MTVQCLRTTVHFLFVHTDARARERAEGVTISEGRPGHPPAPARFGALVSAIRCFLSVGLIPENELSRARAGDRPDNGVARETIANGGRPPFPVRLR